MNKNALEVIYILIHSYTTSFFIVQFEWRRAQLSVLNHEEKKHFFLVVIIVQALIKNEESAYFYSPCSWSSS